MNSLCLLISESCLALSVAQQPKVDQDLPSSFRHRADLMGVSMVSVMLIPTADFPDMQLDQLLAYCIDRRMSVVLC